jgi:hypothetical protein
VARNEVHRILNTSDATPGFDVADPLLEYALSSPSAYDCQPIGVADRGVVYDLLLQLPFPKVKIVSGDRPDVARSKHDGRNLLANNADGVWPYPVGTHVFMRIVHVFDMRNGKIAKEKVFEMRKPARSFDELMQMVEEAKVGNWSVP